MPRVPLPLKVFLSYLLVVVVGGAPTFLYLGDRLESDLLGNTAVTLRTRATRVASQLRGLSPEKQLQAGARMALLMSDRLSLIAADGSVRFDSHVANPLGLPLHADRPEVQAVLSGHEANSFGLTGPGLGVARRVSATLGTDALYVAVLTVDDKGERSVVRLMADVQNVQATVGSFLKFVSNAMAVAMSVAILLSLLAAFVLVRPLRRVVTAAHALAGGDYTHEIGVLPDDDIGDVGRALTQLGAELRRKAAHASVEEASLVQLVEMLPAAVAVFDAEGSVLAINGAARRQLSVEGPRAGRRIRQMLSHPRFREALDRAEEDGLPVPIKVRVDKDLKVTGFVHVLKRAGAPALRVYYRRGEPLPTSILPAPGDVYSAPLEAVFQKARASAAESLGAAHVTVDQAASLPSVALAEANDRLSDALGQALKGCGRSFSGKSGTLNVDVEVRDTLVGFAIDATPETEVIDQIRPLLETLGGRVEVGGTEVTLWLPRA